MSEFGSIRRSLWRRRVARRLRLMRRLIRVIRTWSFVSREWNTGNWHVKPKPWETYAEIEELLRQLQKA